MGKSEETHTALWPYLGMIEGSWGCQEDRVQVAHLSPVSFSFTVSPWNPHDRFQDSCPLPFLQLKILWFNVRFILNLSSLYTCTCPQVICPAPSERAAPGLTSGKETLDFKSLYRGPSWPGSHNLKPITLILKLLQCPPAGGRRRPGRPMCHRLLPFP